MSLSFSGLAGNALARHDPIPPPSGIVVHLFGPHSITSSILPEAPGPAAGNEAATAPGAAASSGPATASGTAPAAASAGYQEPTMHDILHQMFVVGDPNMKPGSNLATGRTSTRP